MCVAILTKTDNVIPFDQLRQGWTINSDGGGFAFVKDDKVEIRKGYMEFEDFYKAYVDAADKYAGTSPFLVHMRITTSGGTSPNNCHPFPIKNGALIHNGVMFTPTGNRAGPSHDRKSDTRVFAESLYNILHLEHVKKAQRELRKAIGSGNKMAFLYDDKSYFILGEDSGYWRDGIWYSNNTCSTSRYTDELRK